MYIPTHTLVLGRKAKKKRKRVKMMRTRLRWFTSGFLVTGGAMAYFIHRDLARDRYLLLAQLNDNFGALATRVFNLESVPQDSSIQQPMGPSVSQNGGSSN